MRDARSQRTHERQHLAPRACAIDPTIEMHHRVDRRLQHQPLRQRRHQHDNIATNTTTSPPTRQHRHQQQPVFATNIGPTKIASIRSSDRDTRVTESVSRLVKQHGVRNPHRSSPRASQADTRSTSYPSNRSIEVSGMRNGRIRPSNTADQSAPRSSASAAQRSAALVGPRNDRCTTPPALAISTTGTASMA